MPWRPLILALALCSAGCATSPASREAAALTERALGLTGAFEALRSEARLTPRELAVRARLAQALGFDAEAARDWLVVAASAPALRPWAGLQLQALSERVPIDAGWLEQVRALPELSELAEMLALKLQDAAALAQARARMGAAFRWRRSQRLLRYPGRSDSPPLGSARFSAPLLSHAGFIASPEEGPGLYAFELELPPGAYRVEVRSPCAVRAFVGPEQVARHAALEALLPERISFPVELREGESLQVHLVSRTAVARARVLAWPAGRASPESSHGGSFVEAMSAIELALAARDVAGAYAGAAMLPRRGLLARFAEARLALADPSRAPERARAAAKATLAALLVLEPAFVEARALLVSLHLDDQELDDAVRVLGAVGPDDPADTTPIPLAELVAQVQQRYVPARAARSAEAILRRLPRACRARADWLDSAWDRLSVRPDAVFALFDEPLSPLPGPCLEARLRAVELARQTFHLPNAERLVEPLLRGSGALDPGPERARAEVLAAQNAFARGAWQLAAEHARQALAAGGVDGFALELLARAERLQGGPPVPRIDPVELGLPLAHARPLIAAHLKSASGRDAAQLSGAEVLLDDRFVRVRADGALRVRVHRIVRVNNVAAVESVGELPIPDDAEILFVRTWKAQGARGQLRALEPEDILEKATVSLPNLAPGDFAEWAYVYPLPAEPRFTPGWRAPTFNFDSSDGPVGSARFTLSLEPGARPPVFTVDPRLSPPERPDPSIWVFSARDLPRLFSEPGDPLPELRHLALGASSGLSHLPLADALAAEIAFNTRASPTLEALLAKATEGLPDGAAPELILQALYDHVRATITEPDEATAFGVEASWVAERRRGSRPLLLTALCRAAGLGCELVLARPLWEGQEPGQPDLDGLVYPLVRWAAAGRPARWLDPLSRWMPFGLLPPALEGVFGLSLGAARRLSDDPDAVGWLKDPARVETPRLVAGAPEGPFIGPDPSHWGERKATLRVTLEPDGATVLAEGSERVDGVFAASWRVALVAMSPETRERVLGAIAQQVLPGATVSAISIAALEDEREPLTWSWRARAPTAAADGVAERGARALQMALLPEGLTHDTVLLPERTTPLLVNRAARLSLTVTVTVPPGWALVRAPSDQDFSYELGRFERKTRFEDLGRTVVVDKRFLLRPGVIEPDQYVAWSDAAVAIDRFDVIQLIAAPVTPRRSPP